MVQAITLPLNTVVDAIHSTVTQVYRRVEITEADNTTIWKASSAIGLLGGGIEVDSTRDERRSVSLSLDNSDRSMDVGPTGLWYDKVIKPYRGVRLSDGSTYERKLGEFLIDSISLKNFPRSVELSGRDFTKKLMNDKFSTTTGFIKNQPVENILRTIALNGGIAAGRITFPLTGKSTGRDFVFDRTVSRWDAMKEIATAYTFDLYFDQDGMMRLETPADPLLDAPQYTFQTGIAGNLLSFGKKLADSRIYNHVVVTGGSPTPDSLPPYASVENNTATSPTRIAKLGRRTYFYTSSFITTQAQCLTLATSLLKIHALEQYEVDLEALVIPYLEAGVTVSFVDPEPLAGQPTKYLLSSFSLPLGLDGMSASVRRVTQVG